MSQKLVVVLGATGTQGGSVVAALLKQGAYSIRAVTRSLDAPAAKELKDKGVEVVSGSLMDKSSLGKAFEGAYAVFGVTIPFTQDDEELQGRNIVDAAHESSVPLLVWSSLPSATEASYGKLTAIHHFDKKNAVDKYIATTGQPTVVIHTGWFAENLLKLDILKPDPLNRDKWTVACPIVRPEAKMGSIWIGGDLGNIVLAIINHWENESWRQRLVKEPVVAAPYDISGHEIVHLLKSVTGKDVTYVQVRDVPDELKLAYSFADQGFYRFPQSSILEELGVKPHSYTEFVREVVAPYMQSAQ
ncbi:NAD(P)-binding protein [Calocera cornea HHB12733]|uniref:NAD(P)-binding protein n=1 Tax=Calocera cornea HHB12733 TaxID=1353952 RepID=A0A165C7U5_9BASI|nr:NAD(P)-binding protein [Calocera cornea HHB12733]